MSDIDPFAAEVRRLLEHRLGVKGADLADQLRRARRLLPRNIRRDGRVLSAAQLQATNPKLSVQVNTTKAQAAAERLITHLRGIDRAERRRGVVLGTLSAIVLNLLIVFVLLIVVLRWRGFV